MKSKMVCYQCAKCTSGCPVAALDADYNPRRYIRLIQLGREEEAAQEPKLWYCLECLTCQERCPEEVKTAEVILELKNRAFRRGFAPEGLEQVIQVLVDEGRIYPVDEFHNEYRQELGLPPLDEEVGRLAGIIRAAGLAGSEEG
ncbi:4Fe-4S dicluster domain-containing protein [Thermanaeromonas toyohensis]|nr:4Fe-4S dicluster domain-containing protein [Thermanaeromonas toyohensis]